ncbi:helix-turn-helix domain-containing protein [Campylobacter sp. 9BO]|uniref:helix-turn-helix domain-containing protein n=1 Tax=Campylobacter sp. 9BO TaxID=3424759 RepID=UPI003D3522ED
MAKISYMPTRLEMDESVSDKAKIFYMRLNRLASNEDEFCYATNEFLMKNMKCGKDKIIQMLDELEKGGYIKIYYTNIKNRSGRKIYTKLDFDFVSAETETDSNFVSAETETKSVSCRQKPTREPINIYNKFKKENLKRKNFDFDKQILNELKEIKKENLSAFKSEKKSQNVINILNLNLPLSVSPKMWGDFVAMRKEIKAPLTQRAAERMVARLANLEAKGYDCDELLDRAIRNGWRDVYEPVQINQNVATQKQNESEYICAMLGGVDRAKELIQNGDAMVEGRAVSYAIKKGELRFFYL